MVNDLFINSIYKLFMKRDYACYFHYSHESNTCEFDGNFDRELFFGNDPDIMRAILKCDNVALMDKELLARNYSLFCGTVGTKSEEYSFEQYIHIKLPGSENEFPVNLSIIWEIDENGMLYGYSGYMISILSVKKLVEKHVNKNVIKAPFNVQNAVRIINENENAAVIQFDIKNFKYINQNYGEAIGDEVLDHIHKRLPEVWGRDCESSRFGADIFTIFTGYDTKEELEKRIDAVMKKLQNYKHISYKFYFGIYLVTDKTTALRKATDYAAIARKTGRENVFNTMCYYSDNFSDTLNNIHEIEAQMENALETGQFHVYLQPKVRISDGVTVGAEALVRWIHPEKGLIPPNKFIPVFERNGFIEKLDMYMTEEVCKILRKWIDMGLEPVSISANVSQVYLSPALPEKMKAILEKYNIPISLFQIEITESYENRQVELSVEEFKKLGFTLLMDDFGSGYSSLNTLSNTSFDIIKLDRAFLGTYLLDERRKKVVTHTISMANDIGLGLVAEGVETDEQADFLNLSGCECAQGFLYSRPIPVAEFEEHLYGKTVTS